MSRKLLNVLHFTVVFVDLTMKVGARHNDYNTLNLLYKRNAKVNTGVLCVYLSVCILWTFKLDY